MKPNMGKTDKAIRVLVAVVLGVLAYTGLVTGTLATVILIVAAVFVLTSLLSFCPLYTLVGINTCPKPKS